MLLSRRAERGDHNSGAWVFPGGIVEPSDALSHDAAPVVEPGESYTARFAVSLPYFEFQEVLAVRPAVLVALAGHAD